MKSTRPTGPLSGIRILDFTRMLVGPIATMMLADMGGDVIKIEPPEGDAMRAMQDGDDLEQCAFFLSANRNKRSVVLDLGAPSSRPTVHALIEHSDIVVHNFMPQLLQKFGLDYESVRAVKKDIIYCGIGAWGSNGEWADRPGTDVLFQAAGGLMSVTGESDGRSMRAGAPIIDVTTGITAAMGILAALRHRDQTGEGVNVETSLFEQCVFAQSPLLAWSEQRKKNPPRYGNRSPLALILELKCSDGVLLVSLPTEKMWQRVCGSFDLASLSSDSRLSSSSSRLDYQDFIADAFNRKITVRSIQDVGNILAANGVPYAPVNDYRTVLADAARISGAPSLEINHEKAGKIRLMNGPLRSSAWNVGVFQLPPLLGQHTNEVLEEIGKFRASAAAGKNGGKA